MSERDGFRPGVPSWVDNLGSDAKGLTDFYAAVFGWDFAGPGRVPGDPPGEYFVARLRDRDVAGVGSLPANAALAPGWSTYIEVQSADRAAENVNGAGGAVLVEPFDAPPAGRMAVVADRAGARFCIWEPRTRRGAQLVNEPGAWSMSSLNTRDRDQAAAFYGDVFGWETDAFQLGSVKVSLFRLPGFVGGEPEQPVPRDVVATMAPLEGDAAEPHWSVDFWVDNVDATLGRAAEMGGSVVVPAYDIPPMLRQAVLSDPGGASFSVTELNL
jgi:uncharacterized protein